MTAAGALGAVVGDHLWYAAGRLGAADRLTALYCKLSLASGRCEARARSRFDRFGPLAIVIGRFVAGVRLFAAPMAGGGAISYPRFLLFELIGAVAWAGLFVALGYAAGRAVARAVRAPRLGRAARGRRGADRGRPRHHRPGAPGPPPAPRPGGLD